MPTQARLSHVDLHHQVDWPLFQPFGSSTKAHAQPYCTSHGNTIVSLITTTRRARLFYYHVDLIYLGD
ncbi:hypothetical protein I3842_04G149300 [Carya illinoinensis]|uniref:Uncharacterized protein n=1 Tax=Carya illinoinensis TaxID=32201 RepID=A0A922FD88_CARIL|nr:hypothetical protein I3842_04G149300 [Carya illinoinensis]